MVDEPISFMESLKGELDDFVIPGTEEEKKFLAQAIAGLVKSQIDCNNNFAISDTMIFRRYGKLTPAD